MSYIKRAWRSVIRRKGKSAILLIVVFILGNLISGTFAIKQAANRVENNLKTKLGFNATVMIDWDSIFNDSDGGFIDISGDDMPKVPESLIKKLADIPEVKFYDYSRKYNITTTSIKSIKMDYGMGFNESYSDGPDEDTSSLSIQGVEHLDLLDAQVGRIEMVDGRTFNAEDLDSEEIPVILSEEIMKNNNFRLDEVVEVKSLLEYLIDYSDENAEAISQNLKFKIVGSFKPVTFGKEKGKNENFGITEMFNRIYMPNQFVKQILDNEVKIAEEQGIDINDNYSYKEFLADDFKDSVFVMDSESDLNSFVDQASLMLDEGLITKTSQQAFQMIAAPIAMLSDFSGAAVKIVAMVTVVILSLVVVLFLRDRKHEMGIYLALGDHQWKVLSQVTLEVVMITLMGLTLSFASSKVVANKISDYLIWESYQGDVFIDTESSYLPAVNLTEVDEDYTVKITPSFIISVYGIGVVVAVAASVVPMFYVTRVKPKKILM